MNTLEKTVREVVLQIAQQRSPELASVDDRQRLAEDLGFSSLDLAQLVATLELELGIDPFAEHVVIGNIREVGDLCRAYRECAPAEGLA